MYFNDYEVNHIDFIINDNENIYNGDYGGSIQLNNQHINLLGDYLQLSFKNYSEFMKFYNAVIFARNGIENWVRKEYGNIPAPCRNCSNHPSNGGDGICHCTLGNFEIY